MDTPSRKSIEEKQLQHSGDLGLEQPGTLYGSTPLPEAFNKHLTDTSGNVIVPEDPSSLSPVETEAPKKRHNRLVLGLGAGAAAIAAGTALVVGLMLPKGDTVGTVPEDETGSTSQPVDNSGNESENPTDEGETGGETKGYDNPDIERIITNPNRITPEKIAAMSPAELEAFATISYESAPSPEAFAERFVTVYDAWVNSGLTGGEFEPYSNDGKGVFENAMGAKYDKVFVDSLFGASGHASGTIEVHNSTLNQFNISNGLTDIPYSLGNEYVSTEVLSDSGTSNGFRIIIHMNTASNSEQTGIQQYIPHLKNSLEEQSIELNVGSIDGNYKIMELKVIEVKDLL